MLEIAGGIILAVLILIFLPWIYLAASFVFVTIIAAVAICGAIWANAHHPELLIIEMPILVLFLLWWYYEIKSRPPALPRAARRLGQKPEEVK